MLTFVNRAWWVSNRERPRVEIPPDALSTYQPQNDTNPDATALEAFLTHPSVRTISADIVAGQIIATIIVVAFVAIFLLREWITQNARPGVFDEADVPPAGAIPGVAEPVVLPVPARIPAPPPPVQNPPQRLPRHEFVPPRQIPVIPADAVRDAFPNPNPNERRFIDKRAWPIADSDSDDDENLIRQEGTGEQPPASPRSNSDVGTSTGVQRRHSWSDGYEWSPPPSRGTPPSLTSEQDEPAVSSEGLAVDEDMGHGQPVETEQVADDFKMDFSNWDPLASLSQVQDAPVVKEEEEDIPLPPTPGIPHGRPPLFSTALFNSSEPGSPPHILPQPSHGNTPLASPSLATYRAPEEFEAGPSNAGYFQNHEAEEHDRNEVKQESLSDSEEWATYFREPRPGELPPIVINQELHLPRDVKEEEVEEEEVEEEEVKEEEVDEEMPPLQNWSDEEDAEDAEEEEDNEDMVVDLPAPQPLAPVEQEELNEAQEGVGANADADAIDMNEELEAGMEDDMEGALEGETIMVRESVLMYILQISWLQLVCVGRSTEFYRM